MDSASSSADPPNGTDDPASRHGLATTSPQTAQQQLATVLANAPIVLWAVDRDGIVTLSQGQGLAALGVQPGELVGRSVFEMYADHPQVLANLRRVLAGETLRVTTKLQDVYLDGLIAPILDETGQVCGAHGVSTDVTDRVRFEQALQQRIEFERLVSHISSRFILLAPEQIDAAIEQALGELGQFTGVDRAYVLLVREQFVEAERTPGDHAIVDNTHEWCAPGIPSSKAALQGLVAGRDARWVSAVIRRGGIIHFPRIDDAPLEAHVERARWQARGVRSMLVVPLRAGAQLMGCVGFETMRQEKTWCDDSQTLLRLAGEIFANALQHQRNTAALVQARRELENRVAERTRELSQAVESLKNEIAQRRQIEHELRAERLLMEQTLSVQERDRRLVAYEIHDGLVQTVAGALMFLQSYCDHVDLEQSPAGPQFKRCLKHLRDAIDEGRRLIDGLRPPIIDELGLVAAIQFLVSDKERDAAVAIEFQHHVRFERVAPILEEALFRIVQEALTNVVRHSRSSRARVALTHDEDRIHLEIRDWGVGFDPRQVVEHRFGLAGIRERARILRGRAHVDSAPGQGTTVSVELPITHPVQYRS